MLHLSLHFVVTAPSSALFDGLHMCVLNRLIGLIYDRNLEGFLLLMKNLKRFQRVQELLLMFEFVINVKQNQPIFHFSCCQNGRQQGRI
jgi:hypothetical protein